MGKNKRQLSIWVIIGSLIIALSQCTTSDNSAAVKEGEYALQSTCIKCHKDISEMYALSAHFHTSSPVSSETFKKAVGQNEFHFNDSLKVVVEKRGDDVFQVTYLAGKEIAAKRFDVAFGSGEKATTFAYWGEKGLFQLPLTHYTKINRWMNSPGFPSDHPDYKRAIVGGCLECHSSYAQTKTVKSGSLAVREEVVKGSIAYGIDCQRCHGPAAKHVAFHEGNPEAEGSKYIVKIKNLSRQQKIDNCAVCHSGNDQTNQRSTFAFQPGDTLSNYYYPYNTITAEPDVHGNQYQMLASSACFIKSDMDCSSCHNTHKTEKNDPVLFSQRCMTCHSASEHPLQEKLGKAITNNCIDCHMPIVPSKIISFQESGKLQKASYLLRSHRIAVYGKDVRKVRRYLEKVFEREREGGNR